MRVWIILTTNKTFRECMEGLKARANKAYSSGEYGRAVELYSHAIEAAGSDNSALSVLHANRSASYFCLQKYEAALKDADTVVALKPSWAKGFEMRGVSLLAMKKYQDALKAFSAGLVFDANSEQLQKGLEEAELELHKMATKKRRLIELTDDFDCMICMKLLYEPVTTSCGHSCLIRALDHSSACPLCRTVIYMVPEQPISVVLQNIIQRNFPDEYKERTKELEDEKVQDLMAMPLFLLSTIAFPEQEFPLHIFEPRLMMRRCMAGSRRFGLVCCTTACPNGESVGCMLEIKELNMLPDGRSFVKTVGTNRFKIIDKWLQDGYMCGKVQIITDDTNEIILQESIQLAQQVQEKIRGFVAEGNADSPAVSKHLAGLIGDMPGIENPEKFSFWVASRLPLTTAQAVQLLQSTSTPTRLRIELELIQQVAAIDQGATRSNCSLQ